MNVWTYALRLVEGLNESPMKKFVVAIQLGSGIDDQEIHGPFSTEDAALKYAEAHLRRAPDISFQEMIDNGDAIILPINIPPASSLTSLKK